MSPPTTFGRRQNVAPPPRFTARDDPRALSPKAEAFRQQLSAKQSASSDFGAWRRSQGPRRAFAWLLGLSLMAPGLLCFALDAPWTVSAALELAGLAANGWLRHERKRHLVAITQWDSDQADL